MNMRRFKDIDVVDAIEIMKKHLKDNRMSLLVGAGVSKCACELYQNWYDFISDMVIYLYKSELELKGIEVKEVEGFYCHYEIENEKDKAKKIIYEIIEREGVLQIPSQFQKRMRIRESIESYIESHIPQINTQTNTVTLFDNTVSLTSKTDFIASMLKIKWNSVFTTNYDNLLEHIAITNELTRFSVGDRASDLSLRNLRDMIIKIHGNIDFEHKSIGFDCDKHRKYIISQEDYDEYPTKHEAFMQLMRITLLKDCLCIVGFSGKDANFISWINWVREIIDVDSSKNDCNNYPQSEDIKVFFIDTRGDNNDEATQQFFENHRIYRILLSDRKVIKLLGVDELDENDPERANKLFKSFFNYLNNDKENDIFYTTFNLWSKLYKKTSNGYYDIEINEYEANKIISSSPYLRIIKYSQPQSNFIALLNRKQEISRLEAELALMALEQMLGDYDIHEHTIIGKIEVILNDNDIYSERINRLRNRHITLNKPHTLLEGNSDMVVYERCLRYAFTFEFSKLHILLKSWNPSDDFLFRKLILLKLVDKVSIDGIISQSFLDKVNPSNERYRATQLANILSGYSQTYSVEEFSDLSENSIFNLRDWYFDNQFQISETIDRYGSSQNKVNEININSAIRCLNFMIEMPIMPQIGGWRMVSDVQWYRVSHALFEKYPYPILFYTITLNSTKLLQRIGQDFAFSKVLHDQLPEIVCRLFKLITDENRNIKYWIVQNICIILSEIIKAVPSSVWDKYFIKIWSKQIFSNFDKIHNSDSIYKLLSSCIIRIQNNNIVARVINDCLDLVKSKGNYNIVKNLFYYTRNNHTKNVSRLIKPSLKNFVESINNYNDIILLGNLHRLVNKSLKNIICDRISKLISHIPINTTSINGLIYYASNNKKILNLVKKSFLSSGLIWNNGISNGVIVEAEFIPIVNLDNMLELTQAELDVLYKQLESSANIVLNARDSAVDVFDYKSLLYEMIQFLDIHRDYLFSKFDAGTLYNKLEKKYKLLTGYKDLNHSIFSDNEEELNTCIRYLKAKIKQEGINNNESYINILITRLLCRNKNSYCDILDFLQYYIRFHINTIEELNKYPQIISLINKISIDELKSLEQDVILCSEFTILLAEKLQKLGLESEGITYWLDLKNSRYFNWSICEGVEE